MKLTAKKAIDQYAEEIRGWDDKAIRHVFFFLLGYLGREEDEVFLKALSSAIDYAKSL